MKIVIIAFLVLFVAGCTPEMDACMEVNHWAYCAMESAGLSDTMDRLFAAGIIIAGLAIMAVILGAPMVVSFGVAGVGVMGFVAIEFVPAEYLILGMVIVAVILFFVLTSGSGEGE